MDEGVTIPAAVLRALGVARGDKVTFVARDDGAIVLLKAARRALAVTGRIRDIVGVFTADMSRTPRDDAVFLREVRYGG